MDTVRKIVQRSYDESVHQKLLTVKYQIERFLKLYDPDSITKAYSDLADARKQLVNPLIMTDEQYVKEWYSNHPGCQNTFPIKDGYLTSRNEEVRSKSEKIIADLFDKYNIPYRYEPRLEMPDGSVVYPDFAVLNVSRRKTMYWEHFGMMDNPEYSAQFVNKINLYKRK